MLFYQTPDHECDQFVCFTKCLMLSLWGSRCCIDRRNVMDGKNRHFSLWNPWMSVSQCVCVCVCVKAEVFHSKDVNAQLMVSYPWWVKASLSLSLSSAQYSWNNNTGCMWHCAVAGFQRPPPLSSCPAFLESPAALLPVSKGQRLKGWFPFGKQPDRPPATKSVCLCVCEAGLKEKK